MVISAPRFAPDIDLDGISRVWPHVLKRLAKYSNSASVICDDTVIIGFDGRFIDVGFTTEFQRSKADQPNARDAIETAISSELGIQGLKVRCVLFENDDNPFAPVDPRKKVLVSESYIKQCEWTVRLANFNAEKDDKCVLMPVDEWHGLVRQICSFREFIHEPDPLTQETPEHLTTMPYQDYLQTQHWQTMRRLAKERAGSACELCHRQEALEVHHKTYDRRGQERLSDLIVLCRSCHSKFHDKLE